MSDHAAAAARSAIAALNRIDPSKDLSIPLIRLHMSVDAYPDMSPARKEEY